jgi:hypothetical protein
MNLFQVRKDNKVVKSGFSNKADAKAVRDELNGDKEPFHHFITRGPDHIWFND